MIFLNNCTQESKMVAYIDFNNESIIKEMTYATSSYRLTTEKDSIRNIFISLGNDFNNIDTLKTHCYDYSTFNNNDLLNRHFKADIKDTIKCLVVYGNRNKLIVGAIEIMPSNKLMINIPYLELIGMFNRTRIGKNSKSYSIDYCIYGFIKNDLIWKVLLSL